LKAVDHILVREGVTGEDRNGEGGTGEEKRRRRGGLVII
jgi:hypothetical protein